MARVRGAVARRRRPCARDSRVGLALVPVVFLMVGLLLNGLMRLLPGLHNVAANPLEQLAAGGPRARRDARRGRDSRRRRARGAAARVSAAPLRAALGRPTVGVLVLSIAFGLGHYPQGWDAVIATGAARRVLGDRLPAAAQQHRADRQPRRIQLAGSARQRSRVALTGS